MRIPVILHPYQYLVLPDLLIIVILGAEWYLIRVSIYVSLMSKSFDQHFICYQAFEKQLFSFLLVDFFLKSNNFTLKVILLLMEWNY